jgi:Metallo-beta-lactamase superfamily
MIAWSALPPALRSRDLSISRTAEILSLAGLLHDDRIPSFTALIQARLAQLPPLIAADVGHWLRTRSDGSPRSRPRHTDTVRMNFNRVRPLLLEWAHHYSHLREITPGDVIAATAALHPNVRRQTLTALRSLFGHCKKTGTIFADPTSGIPDGQRPLSLLQPLQPGEIDQATAVVTPAARLALALAAVHAARPRAIRQLRLADIDLGSRRLVITGRARPLDDLTRHLLLAWLGEVIHTPGHSPGHVCLWSAADRILLSGDHLLPKIASPVTFERGFERDPMSSYLDSLRRVAALGPALVLPGHGEPFPDGARRAAAVERTKRRPRGPDGAARQ